MCDRDGDGDPSFGHYGSFVSIEATGLLFGRAHDRAGVSGFRNQLSSDIEDHTNKVPGHDVDDVYGVEVYYNAEITP